MTSRGALQTGGLAQTPHKALGQLVEADISDRVARRLGVDPASIPTSAQYNSWGSWIKGQWTNFAYRVRRFGTLVRRTFVNMATSPFRLVRNVASSIKQAGGIRSFLSPTRIATKLKQSITAK